MWEREGSEKSLAEIRIIHFPWLSEWATLWRRDQIIIADFAGDWSRICSQIRKVPDFQGEKPYGMYFHMAFSGTTNKAFTKEVNVLGFLIVAVILFNLVAYLIPKKLSRLEIWTTILFASLLEVFVDVCLDLKLNLYGYFNPGFEWAAIIPVIGLYPAASTIFLNFYPFKSSRFAQVSYIASVSIFCVLFEFASLKFGYFYYQHWRLWYSALCYPILLCILIWNLTFIRKLNLVSEK